MRGKRWNGSFTAEAALLFPVLILLTAFFLQTAVSLYQETERTAAEVSEIRELDSLKIFLAGELMSDEN